MTFLNTNAMKTTKLFLSAILSLALFASCSNDDDSSGGGEPNEDEVITNVTFRFVNNADASDVVTLLSVDPDGDDGPLEPTLSVTGAFNVGDTYTATVNLYNSIEDEDITIEVTEDEPDEHFFVYGINGLDMTFARSANDIERMDGNFLGFETTWTANSAGTGTITVQLFHESETVDSNANEGLGAQTGGSADVNITFSDVVIQ